MPRKPGIWWNTGKNAYYVKIQGKPVRLSADLEEAQALYEQLKRKEKAPDLQDYNTCRTIFNLYLDYIEKEHEESYRTCKNYLQSFLDHHNEIQIKDLRTVLVQQWMNAHPTWGQSSQYSAIGWVVSALNWAAKPENRYITRNPIARMHKPAVRSRGEEAVIDPEDHKALYEAANPCLKQVLFALQQTGTRPSNLCRITSADCDFTNSVIVLSRHKTVRKTGSSIKIPMTPALCNMLEPLCEKYPTGPIFRTRRGRPWTANYISEIVGRLRKRIGMTSKATPYGYRHTVATQLLMNGVPDAHVAQILGHTSTVMVHRHYGHLGKFMQPLINALDSTVNPKPTEDAPCEEAAGEEE